MRLVKIDISKAKGHHHSDIKADGTNYLVRISNKLYAGTFSMQWYGLNFKGWNNSTTGLQFDKPGTNGSNWQEIYQLHND